MKTCPAVIFVTTEFDQVDHGPGTFTRYLWESFHDEPELAFYLVAATKQKHPRIIGYPASASPREYYRNLETALRGCIRAIRPSTSKPIVHINMPHSVAALPEGCFNIVQANDYYAAHFFKNMRAFYLDNSWRRVATMYWRRVRERNVFRSADLILANSEYTRNAIVGGYGLRSARVQRLYKAVDVQRFSPADVMDGKAPGNIGAPVQARMPRLVFVGSNWILKGFDILLEALIKLRAGGLAPALVVVGPTDTHRNRYWAEKAMASPIKDQVHFAGRVAREELPGILWRCDIGILPSRQEALGVAVIECMAAGLPVVACRTGGIPEIVRDESEGLLVESQSVDALCEGIKRMMKDEHYRKLKQNVLARAQDFSRKQMTESLKQIYLSVSKQ